MNASSSTIERTKRSDPAENIAVQPDELGLWRFARSVRNIFLPAFANFDTWRLEEVDQGNWSARISYDAHTIYIPKMRFANRDALRAYLIVTCALVERSGQDARSLVRRLSNIKEMAEYIHRYRLAGYLNALIQGFESNSVRLETGSHLWLFAEFDWMQPTNEVVGDYDKLFEDSLASARFDQILTAEQRQS